MRLFFTTIFFLVIQFSFAQGITIKEVKETVSGTEAFHAPIDSNGNPCGLVKVLSTIEDLSFDGSIIGNVENKTNEYHVFLSKGSKELTIRRSHVLPVKVRFEDYGIDEISSKATYSIMIKSTSLNENKNRVTFGVRPKDTNVCIDGISIANENEDGFYQLLLSKGEHVIQFEAKGYRSSTRVVKAGKESVNFSVDLESLLATLDIRCQTSTAEIWLGDEMKGKGAWQGKLPAGKYIVTAKQKGFTPQTKEVTLEEKSSRSFVLPTLERAIGILLIKTDPAGGTITIDGQSGYKSDTPLAVKAGQHTIIAKLPFGYKEEKREIEVDGENLSTINIKMVPLNAIYAAAFKGDIDKQLLILNTYIDSIEGTYWCNQINEKIIKMDNSSFLEYCNKACWDANYFFEILLRQAELDKGWSSDEDKRGKYSQIVSYYNSHGNIKEAIVWGEKLCKISPTYGSYMTIAELYEKAGDISRAVIWYKKAASEWGDINNRNSWGWAMLDLADVYLRLSYNKEAAEIYRFFIQKSPNDKDVNEWRNKLRQTGYK